MIDFIKSTDDHGRVCVREVLTNFTYEPTCGARGLHYDCDAYSAALARESWEAQAKEAYRTLVG